MKANLLVELAQVRIRLEAINIKVDQLEGEIRRLEQPKPDPDPETAQTDPVLLWGQ